jgi:hypothetical protein
MMAGIASMKRALPVLALAAAGLAQSPHRTAGPNPVQLERATNTYAIYSLLLTDDPSPGVPQKQGPVAIADTTVNISDMNPAIAPDSQLQPPPGHEQSFHEAVQDFRSRRYERVGLTHKFHLGDYTLLTPGQVAAYRQAQTGYPAITFFSEVYFDSKQTAALVYRNNFCGNLCANSEWIYLEKRGRQWVRRSGLNI